MINNFTCIIVDDETDASELLESRLRYLYKNIEIIAKYNNWESALNGLRNAEPDILFLDISMPEKTGMDLLKLMPELRSELIFTTSYSEYAIQAFAFAATGYILKPIDDAELVKAVEKAIERTRNKKLAKQNTNGNTVSNQKIGIAGSKGIDYVNVDDIIYVEAQEGYTNIITHHAKLLSSYNMGRIKPMLNSMFYQVHRSYIVNMKWIERYESAGLAIMCNKAEIPVSRKERDEFLKFFSTLSNGRIA